jgi:hypothetical protein
VRVALSTQAVDAVNRVHFNHALRSGDDAAGATCLVKTVTAIRKVWGPLTVSGRARRIYAILEHQSYLTPSWFVCHRRIP